MDSEFKEIEKIIEGFRNFIISQLKQVGATDKTIEKILEEGDVRICPGWYTLNLYEEDYQEDEKGYVSTSECGKYHANFRKKMEGLITNPLTKLVPR